MDTPPPSVPSAPPPLPPERPALVPLPPSRGGKGTVVLIPLVALALAVAAVWHWKSRSSNGARIAAGSAEDRAAGIRASFHGNGQPVSLTNPEAVAIDAILRRMTTAFVKKDAAALADCFDFAGLLELAAAQNQSPSTRNAARRARRDPGYERTVALEGVKGLMQTPNHESYVRNCCVHPPMLRAASVPSPPSWRTRLPPRRSTCSPAWRKKSCPAAKSRLS